MPAKIPRLSAATRLSAELAALPAAALRTERDLDALGVAAASTLKCWRSRGLGPQSVILAGGPRYRVGDLRKWIDAGGVRGTLHRHPTVAA